MSKRIGRFSVTKELLEEADLDAMARVFSDLGIVPIRIEPDAMIPGVLEYTAYSTNFDLVECVDDAPRYLIHIWSECVAGVVCVSRAKAERL